MRKVSRWLAFQLAIFLFFLFDASSQPRCCFSFPLFCSIPEVAAFRLFFFFSTDTLMEKCQHKQRNCVIVCEKMPRKPLTNSKKTTTITRIRKSTQTARIMVRLVEPHIAVSTPATLLFERSHFFRLFFRLVIWPDCGWQ